MPNRHILLVEDEKEKRLALLDALRQSRFEDSHIESCDSVRDAVLAVYTKEFHLIVLDVSLPTYGASGMTGSAGRAQQQSGGLEILRTLKHLRKKPKIIIVTQHPDVLFNQESVELKDVAARAKELYSQNVLSAILYREADGGSWREEFSKTLRKCS